MTIAGVRILRISTAFAAALFLTACSGADEEDPRDSAQQTPSHSSPQTAEAPRSPDAQPVPEADAIAVPAPSPALRPPTAPQPAQRPDRPQAKPAQEPPAAPTGTANAPAAVTPPTSPAAPPAPDKMNPLAALKGRWTGKAVAEPTSGRTENFKCVATYRDGAGGEDDADLIQRLRCESENYKLDATADMKFNGRHLQGVWLDRVRDMGGTMIGVVTDKGLDVLLKGEFLEAYMQVVTTKCAQVVTVRPMKITYLRTLSAKLRKC